MSPDTPRSALGMWLTIVLGALCVIGLVMVGSASSVVSISYYGSTWAILLRECLWMVVGVGAFWFAAGRSTKSLGALAVVGIVGTIALLALVLAPGFGTSSFGASRWLGFGWLRIQPSELAKLALCLYAAHVIAKKERVEREWGRVLRPLAIVTLVAALLVLAQPDMGTAVVLLAIAFAVATAAGAPWRALSCTIGVLILGCGLAAIAMPYRRARLLSFLHPQTDPSGSGYQLLQSKIGFGSGGITGKGIGNSALPWGALPNPHTDFIFSIVGNELGLVGALAVLGLLVALVLLGLRVAAQADDRFSQLAAVGISAWLATETIVNIGAVTGVLPVTGIPLPFISFGGTSLVIDMAAVGVLVGIARRSVARPSLRVVATARATPHDRRPSAPRRTAACATTVGCARLDARRARLDARCDAAWHRSAVVRATRPSTADAAARARVEPRGPTAVSGPVVLTGGGTGGHVFPLRAIAQALLEAEVPPTDLVVVGSRRGQDGDLLGDLGVELVLLPGRGLRRDVSARAALANLIALAGLSVALVRGVGLVARRRPRVVVSVGGYAAFSSALGAVVTGRPLVLVDLDATPGLVHRILRPFAVAVTVAFPGATDERVVVTGAPLRAEILAVERTPGARARGRERLGLPPTGAVVAVTSGSLGAASVNRATCELAVRWRGREATMLYHVTGRRDVAEVEDRKREEGIGDDHWRVVAFEPAMADVWAACDVAVTRAGATTVAELCATGVPSVLVALPGAPGDHQSANARILERAGAAVVLSDATLSGAALDDVLSALLGDTARLAAMSSAARSLARPDAASRIAQVVLDHAR